jgi:hypothetical protein
MHQLSLCVRILKYLGYKSVQQETKLYYLCSELCDTHYVHDYYASYFLLRTEITHKTWVTTVTSLRVRFDPRALKYAE